MVSLTIERVVADLLAETRGVSAADLTRETRLGEDGLGLDSVTTLELLLALEKAAGVRLRDEGLTGEAISTLGGLMDYVDSLRGE